MNAGEIIQGRYRLEEALGRGGMGTVWRSLDLRLERPVALKCLTPPLSEHPEYLVRFFSEAQQVARLNHPNVVRVLDFGQGDECPYLVMEYLEGGSLVDLTGVPVDPDRAIDIIAGAARGAGAAHDVGMVHRDLKPGNILLTAGGIPKLADFGIAVTRAQERLTATGTAIGSPHYVSPEQASGRPVGPPSDVYSLGVVLYELVAGERPFESENAMALAIAHVDEEPQAPSVHNPDLPPAIDTLVMRALAKDPEKRYADGAEFAAALDGLAADDAPVPITSTPTIATTSARADDSFEEDSAGRNVRRLASVSLLVALFLGLLIFGVMAFGSGADEEKAVADATEDSSTDAKKGGSKKSSVADDDSEAPTTERQSSKAKERQAPTPSPSAADAREEKEINTVTDETAQETEEEEDPVNDPTPEPTQQPTEEPAPDPTPTP